MRVSGPQAAVPAVRGIHLVKRSKWVAAATMRSLLAEYVCGSLVQSEIQRAAEGRSEVETAIRELQARPRAPPIAVTQLTLRVCVARVLGRCPESSQASCGYPIVQSRRQRRRGLKEL